MEDNQEQEEVRPPERKGGLRIEKEFIETLPVGAWDGPIDLVENENDAEKAVAALRGERVLGFDTETKPSHTRGEYNLPSILQLAGEKRIFIFRLDHCGGIPLAFPLLCNERQAKVGVAVRDDVRNLRARAPFDDRAFIDISDHTTRAGVENTGLRALAAHYLGLQMKKSKKVQTSNWARPLDERQIHYAANDAWFSRELFLKLEKDGLIPRFG
ncbi:MAG: 3'-5' exonuclease [Opitutales bacterium]